MIFLKSGILWFTAKFGRQFTDEIHNLGIILVLGDICRVLSNILECNHDFWILQDKKKQKIRHLVYKSQRLCGSSMNLVLLSF